MGVLGIVPSLSSAAGPNDPFYTSKGAWKQTFADQWGLKRIGFTQPGNGESAWDIETGEKNPVIVAVIDSGLDYHHPDLNRRNIWRNPKETENGKDDDGNGYVDDLIGWNFVNHTNRPWDRAGHGTHVAGIIAAATNNGHGIAGMNRGVQIMPLKALDFVGEGRSVTIAKAIYYAVQKGARVINLSLGGHRINRAEQRAINYAWHKNVVVVVAVGNENVDAAGVGPAAVDNVISVGATGPDNKRAPFSNWGAVVDIAAPGIDVLSLRARRTDLLLMRGAKNYEPGGNFIGKQAQFYRATGTSFSAPFVSGVASLLIAKDPKLTAKQVRRMILHSAKDIETPGVDQYTGYGLLDARAALSADPQFFVEARITGVQVAKVGGKTVVRVLGIADGNAFGKAWIELGPGKNPTKWKKVSRTIAEPVKGSALDDLATGNFRGSKEWVLRLITEHQNGRRREARFNLKLG